MARVILSIVFLLILAVVIVLNIGNVTAFNVFGWKVEGFPVTAIAIVSFVLGVLYSFLYYLLRYFSKMRRERMAKRGKELKDREQSLKLKEKSMEDFLKSNENSGNGGAKLKGSRFAFLSKMAKKKKAESKPTSTKPLSSTKGKS
jgi:uncharacterized integral membrane protein